MLVVLLRKLACLAIMCGGLFAHGVIAQGEESALKVGFGQCDITPDVRGRPVWIAGYGQNRRATGVHDPIMCRAVVLSDGKRQLALASVDLVGLQYPEVQAIRQRLPQIDYVMVASTHNHEGPDVIGLWGPSPLQTGVQKKYLQQVVDGVVQAVNDAAGRLIPAVAEYGVAEDASLLGDSRLPKVYDGVLRLVRFLSPDRDRTLGLLVQWNGHPESMGPKNTLLTADFPWATVAALSQKHHCPVVYVSGAVGGLMAPPDGLLRNEQGQILEEGDFAFAEKYGQQVALLAEKAIAAAEPAQVTPLSFQARPIAVPLANPLYLAGRALGVLRRAGRVWTGNAAELGEIVTGGAPDGKELAVETEVACLRLGEIHVACIPGELYPELVYGQFQEPAEPDADFPQAPLEPTVMQSLPRGKSLVIGLANDEIGYIIPKRQWDNVAPFAYGRSKEQYGEINSVGPEAAPVVMEALRQRAAEAR